MPTSVFDNKKKFSKGEKFEPKETKGEIIRKKLKDAMERTSEKKLPKRNPKNITEIDKSLKNLKSDFRFPKKEKPPIESFKKRKSPNRVPGEQKEMIPMAKGGRAGFKAGSKGCKLAMKGKGRAYGKNS